MTPPSVALNEYRRFGQCGRGVVLWVAVGLLFTANARADSGNIEDILPLANDPNDPIGLERDPALDLPRDPASAPGSVPGRAAQDLARFGPSPPPFAARSGEALSAVQSVRERSHRVSVELTAGLALLQVELVLENTSDKPAEAQYRLAVPADAALAGLEVCNPQGCRSGIAAPGGALDSAYDDALRARGPRATAQQLPLAHVFGHSDARGSALIVRAAPVDKARPLTVRVRYLSAAPLHGGVARLRLPARGMDPRAAALELTLTSSELRDLRAGVVQLTHEPTKIDPWQSVEISGRSLPGGKVTRSVWKFDCGARQCARAYVSAPPLKAAAVDLVLAIDASPSTEGAARSRLLPTLAAILAQAPEGSRVRALRFASQAKPLVRERQDPASLSLATLSEVAFEAELGSATRFESAWEQIRSLGLGSGKPRRLIVIVGDGGLTRGKAKPFEAARRAGAEVSVVNVADRASTSALVHGAQLTGGIVIDAGAEADEAMRGGSPDALEERVAALYAPVAVARPSLSGVKHKLPALRAGESLTLEALSSSSWTLQAGGAARSSTVPERFGFGPSVRAASRAGLLDPHHVLIAVDARDLSLREADATARRSQSIRASTRTSIKGGSAAAPAKRAAATSCDRRGPAWRQGGVSSDERPVALAVERAACAKIDSKSPAQAPPDTAAIGSAMPSSPLLGMLRQRILPVARGCFRRDRAGRADYQVRAVFEFELAEREVISADVTGKITDVLRSCLLAAVDELAVPRFSGRVVVRYPLVTERETLPSQIELTPEAAVRVDALIATGGDSTP